MFFLNPIRLILNIASYVYHITRFQTACWFSSFLIQSFAPHHNQQLPTDVVVPIISKGHLKRNIRKRNIQITYWCRFGALFCAW